MKNVVVMGLSLVAAMALLSSCNKKNHEDPYVPQPVENAFEGAVPTGYYGYAEISVPAGTETVYIEYTHEDGSTKTIAQKVSPIVATPENGKDVEPFGTVKLFFEADEAAKVSVYYNISEATKADGDDSFYTLEDFPVDKISSGEFGKTRYVHMPWDFGWENREVAQWTYANVPTYPKDVVFYDAEHDHTLRYTIAYGGTAGSGEDVVYVLTDAYEVVDHVVTKVKYNYCTGCGNCPKCMPWGCDCGCGSVNDAFQPSGNTTASAGDDATVVDPEVPGTTPTVDGNGEVTVGPDGNIDVDYKPSDVTDITLPEPASYVTEDAYFTNYHSSGVVMFDDRWPNLPDIHYLYDYNDVVVDYDIEARTVADEFLESDGWREQVKVTMHVRALGGDDAIGVGLVLENFNTDYVSYVEQYQSLDSWQNPHGELPKWTKTTLQENSLRYDNLDGAYIRNTNNLRPAVEIGRLQALNSVDTSSQDPEIKGKTSGNEVYQYIDKDGQAHDHVFNPARRQWAAWGGAHTDQYDPSLPDLYAEHGKTFSGAQNLKLYNTIPGFINEVGGLYTLTVIYYMKPRAEMSPEQSAACKANMMDAVVNTTSQNFYLVKKDHGTVGLKGYKPLDCAVKDYNKGYKSKYDEEVAKYGANMDLSTTFKAANGMVWGFKCPTLTKHAWELMPFAVAYPNYEEWVTSNGASHADWYKDESVNQTALVCEW